MEHVDPYAPVLTTVTKADGIVSLTGQILENPVSNTDLTEISPNYKGKHPKSKEELAKIRAEKLAKKSVYESKDPAVNPGHYKSKNGLEVIDCIEAFTEDLTGVEAVCVGNILKYICRYKKKNGLTDCRKARWYIEKLIQHLEEQEKKS